MDEDKTALTAEKESSDKEKDKCGCNMKTTIKMRKHKQGFTNKLAIYLVLLLTIGLFMAYNLAKLSIQYNYMGQLLCFTVVFTPLGTAISLVLGKIVDKSKAENSAGDGTGIKFAQAQANGFQDIDEILETPVDNSCPTQPAI